VNAEKTMSRTADNGLMKNMIRPQPNWSNTLVTKIHFKNDSEYHCSMTIIIEHIIEATTKLTTMGANSARGLSFTLCE
jgi:hypothetical protein